MSAGSLSALFSWAALAFTLATLVSSGLALHYRNVSGREKDLEIASIRLEAAKSNAEAARAHEHIAVLQTQAEALKLDTAEANARAAEAQERLSRVIMSRAHFLSGTACTDFLRGKPAARAEILWQRGVGDAEWLAFRIGGCLAGDTGVPWWKIERVGPIDSLPSAASSTGITVIGKRGGKFVFNGLSKAPNVDTPLDIVGSALWAGFNEKDRDLSFGIDGTLPDDLVQIVIGPKL